MVVGRKGAKKEKEVPPEEDVVVKKPKKSKKAAAAKATEKKKEKEKEISETPETPEKKEKPERTVDPIRSPLFNISKPIPSSPTAGQSHELFHVKCDDFWDEVLKKDHDLNEGSAEN